MIGPLIANNIRAIVDTFDAHDPGIYEGEYICACRWRGPEADWYTHLADALGELLTLREVELPFEAVS